MVAESFEAEPIGRSIPHPMSPAARTTAVLTPITGMLEGLVKDLDADTLLPGATVWIEQEEIKIDSALTDEEGYYSIPGIRVGIYDVIASIENFVNDTVKGVEIVEGDLTVDFALATEEETSTSTNE